MTQPGVERGKLVVISAPSGAGKTSLVRELLERVPSLEFSISYTTRPPRDTEVHGRDYFFVQPEEFAAMRARGEFLESASVFDNWYGTSRSVTERLLRVGRSVLLEIDWQGAGQIRANAPEAVTIFILPPSGAELERRLRGRGTDPEPVIARRLADALGDMSHWSEFDYVVVNDDLQAAADALARILDGRGEEFSTASDTAARAVADVLSA